MFELSSSGFQYNDYDNWNSKKNRLNNNSILKINKKSANTMTKRGLFKKYSIDESHNVWDNQIDNWYSIEVYRIMHDGKLPPGDDLSTKWITDFLDKVDSDPAFLIEKENWGSLYLTSKRMVYSHADDLLKNINSN